MSNCGQRGARCRKQSKVGNDKRAQEAAWKAKDADTPQAKEAHVKEAQDAVEVANKSMIAVGKAAIIRRKMQRCIRRLEEWWCGLM